MGIAAYNRGSQAIRHALDGTQRDPVFQCMEELNALPKYADAGTLWCPVTLTPRHNVWWIEGPKGARGYSYAYPSLRECVRRWRIALTAYDATTGVWTGAPLSPLPTAPARP